MKKAETLAVRASPSPRPSDLTRLEIDEKDPELAEAQRRAKEHQGQVWDRLTPLVRILTAHDILWQDEKTTDTLEYKMPKWLSWSGPIAWFAGSSILFLQAGEFISSELWWSAIGAVLCLYAAIVFIHITQTIQRDAAGLYKQFAAPSFDQRLANQASIAVIALRDDLVKHVALDDLKAMAIGLERRREVRARLLGAPSTVGWLTQLAAVVAVVGATLTLANNLQSASPLVQSGLGTQLWLLTVFLVGIYGVSLAYWSSALSDSQVWLERKLRAVGEAIVMKEKEEVASEKEG